MLRTTTEQTWFPPFSRLHSSPVMTFNVGKLYLYALHWHKSSIASLRCIAAAACSCALYVPFPRFSRCRCRLPAVPAMPAGWASHDMTLARTYLCSSIDKDNSLTAAVTSAPTIDLGFSHTQSLSVHPLNNGHHHSSKKHRVG